MLFFYFFCYLEIMVCLKKLCKVGLIGVCKDFDFKLSENCKLDLFCFKKYKGKFVGNCYNVE